MDGWNPEHRPNLLPGLSRELRERQTEAEEYLWEVLRNRKFRGLKFRRQHRIANYVADFCCLQLKLIVELDGGVHSTDFQIAHDEHRDRNLEVAGYRVVRVPNHRVFEDLGAVMRRLAAVVAELEGRSGD